MEIDDKKLLEAFVLKTSWMRRCQKLVYDSSPFERSIIHVEEMYKAEAEIDNLLKHLVKTSTEGRI